MDYFKKLPESVRSPSGLEWILLKKIPRIFLITAFVPCAVILSLYLWNDVLNAEQLKIVFQCLGVLFSIWFFIGALTIGCILVILMKGPAYVADPYELPTENESLENNTKL
ncbi:MAG: hypothetical protein PSV17_01625 [Methylotenera sp.]|uniref:hypothetical protein n=1 Tax=Methylotenera sp. TaxID=2051956 RepID=UPI0024873D4F|nr:hypothetical protein [Methylotenera sp.]MDI1308119.1 hypothetical protein [Methylotenera sp.]